MSMREARTGATPSPDLQRQPSDYTIDGRVPAFAVAPRSAEEVAAVLAAAAADGHAVVPQGARTALRLGRPLERYDIALDLRELASVVAYEPEDLTVTVEAGMSLAQLNALLREHNQELPFDPPPDDRVTVGGLLATARPGARRSHVPAARDLVLGVRVAMPDGALTRSGGRVVKNVSGYDLHRLHTGALGAFGVIVEASFKVLPQPERRKSLVIGAPDLEGALVLAFELWDHALPTGALSVLGVRAAAALGLAATPHVLVEYAGSTRALERCEAVAGEVAAAADSDARPLARDAWSTLRALAGEAGSTQDGAKDGTEDTVLRLGVPPTRLTEFIAAGESHGPAWGHLAAGSVLVRAPAAQGGLEPRTVTALRERARSAGGFLQIEAAPAALRAAVDPFGAREVDLVRALQASLDLRGTLNPGRWHKDEAR